MDGTGAKCWRAPQDVKSAWLEVELAQPAVIGSFGLDKPEVTPRMRQQFTLEVFGGGEWKNIVKAKPKAMARTVRSPPSLRRNSA